MDHAPDRRYANPEAAARKLMKLASTVETIQDGRIYIEEINRPFIVDLRGTPAEYAAGLKFAIERGWLDLHESGTYVRLTKAGAEKFA